MFFKPKEHEPSHIHALYGEYMGEFNIQTMEMIQGDLPGKAIELVREWIACHQEELQKMRDQQRIEKLPPKRRRSRLGKPAPPFLGEWGTEGIHGRLLLPTLLV